MSTEGDILAGLGCVLTAVCIALAVAGAALFALGAWLF